MESSLHQWARAPANERQRDQIERGELEKRGENRSCRPQVARLEWLAHDEAYARNSLQIHAYERKLCRLARHFRLAINFFGLAQDPALLLVDGRVQQEALAAGRWTKLARLVLVISANSLVVFMLFRHLIWELFRLEAKLNAQERQLLLEGRATNSSGSKSAAPVSVTAAASQAAAALASGSTESGWLVLKDFLENLRRHLSRQFAVALIVMWHKKCGKFEMLFADIRRYHAFFHCESRPRGRLVSGGEQERDETTIGNSQEEGEEEEEEEEEEQWTASASSGALFAELASGRAANGQPLLARPIEWARAAAVARRKLAAAKERQAQYIKATRSFYRLARGRLRLALCVPLLHLSLNIFGILVNPRALVAANRRSGGGAGSLGAGGLANGSQVVEGEEMATAGELLLANFNHFHRSIHTAFHPSFHQIEGAPQPPALSSAQSAAYCMAELFIHHVYIHGTRILCAVCLSLALALHCQCLAAFNRRLGAHIKRASERPLSRADMARLLKLYDLIGSMHERIEQTFKWSLVLWFSLMFISCLMLIFTLAESTSMALSARSLSLPAPADAATGAAKSPTVANATVAAPGLQTVGVRAFLETVSPLVILTGRIVFICLGPWLIYTEAFKLEAENARTGQLVMALARRRNDPVAQAIEPSLFEPICFNVNGYFNISKRSVASFFGAIVTFSIMFIGECFNFAHFGPGPSACSTAPSANKAPF